MARIEKSIEVSVPLRAAYNQWTQFEQFDKFMDDVREVKQIDDTHLHGKTEMDNKEGEFDCEITEQVPDKRIAWRSRGLISASGEVAFRAISHDRTEIRLTTEFDPKDLGPNNDEIIAKGEVRMENGLRRFKEFMEWLGRETGAWRSKGQAGKAVDQPVRLAREFTRQVEKEMESATDTIARNLPIFWQEPFGMMRRMWGEMDHLLESFAVQAPATKSRQQPSRTLGFSWQPRLDMVQKGDDVVVCADLPGMRPDDVRVHISGDSLIMEGERETETRSSGDGAIRSERSYGHFYRMLSLPKGLDVSGAKASMKEGVLKVTIPVSQAMRGRELEIEIAKEQDISPRRSSPSERYRETETQARGQTQQYGQSGRHSAEEAHSEPTAHASQSVEQPPYAQTSQSEQTQKERRHAERRARAAAQVA